MKFYESEYEEALIDLLREVGWDYTHGSKLHRTNREMLLMDDLRSFLEEQHTELESEDVESIIALLRHTGGQTHFAQLRSTYRLLTEGYRYTRQSDGQAFDIAYIDFDEVGRNRFRVVNQFEVGYGQGSDIRIPDVLLFVNGIPLCIIELKNPTDATATIADAYEQIHTRYRRDRLFF